MKKKPKPVFGVAVLLIRNGYILSLISSFPSTSLKLTKLQVERTFLVFPGKYFSLRSKTPPSPLKRAKLGSTTSIFLQPEHMGMQHVFLQVLCFSIHEYLYEGKF